MQYIDIASRRNRMSEYLVDSHMRAVKYFQYIRDTYPRLGLMSPRQLTYHMMFLSNEDRYKAIVFGAKRVRENLEGAQGPDGEMILVRAIKYVEAKYKSDTPMEFKDVKCIIDGPPLTLEDSVQARQQAALQAHDQRYQLQAVANFVETIAAIRSYDQNVVQVPELPFMFYEPLEIADPMFKPSVTVARAIYHLRMFYLVCDLSIDAGYARGCTRKARRIEVMEYDHDHSDAVADTDDDTREVNDNANIIANGGSEENNRASTSASSTDTSRNANADSSTTLDTTEEMETDESGIEGEIRRLVSDEVDAIVEPPEQGDLAELEFMLSEHNDPQMAIENEDDIFIMHENYDSDPLEYESDQD